ncbi:MAG: Rieske 2Fe-2S domain-containing protein [Ktedonobacteraceae bacterium]
MPGEDQERFEDYLDLEHFISELQAGRVAHPRQEMTLAQARIYQMATQFHAASPGVGEPRPEFAAHLQTRLETEIQAQQDTQQIPLIQTQPPSARPKPRISRRMLLAGSAATAASVAVGAGIEHMVDQAPHPQTPVTVIKWFPVATVAELGDQAIKFTTANLIGYVVKYIGTNENSFERNQIIAVSAACTHKGCIVNWDTSDRKFHCPCHGRVFMEDGGIDTHQVSPPWSNLDALPRLDVHIQDGQIYVKMPLT